MRVSKLIKQKCQFTHVKNAVFKIDLYVIIWLLQMQDQLRYHNQEGYFRLSVFASVWTQF